MALGYSQIPGVDYTYNFAAVAHDVSFRIALARIIVEKLDSLVMDVETAFLYGDIEEEITEVWILQGIYPLKDEWVFGCSLKTRLADQTKTQQLKWLWSIDSMKSTINQRLVEQTQEMNFKLEGSGGSTLVTP